MAKAPKATTFSSRSNAKRAAEKAIATGTAPSSDYGIKERPSGRFEIAWHDRAAEARERLGMSPTTEEVEEEIATATAEADTPTSNPFARIEASEAAADPLDYRARLLAADAARRQPMVEPAETEASATDLAAAEEEREPDEVAEAPAEPITNPSDGEGDMPDIFPPGTRVIVQVGKRKRSLGVVDYRVDATFCRVKLDGPNPSELFRYNQLALSNAAESSQPAEKPQRKPRAAPSGDRKPSKSGRLDAAAARGEMPEKPIMTSPTNKAQYQPRFDKLEAMATAGDWDGVRAYEVKGINSYAKMVAAYRDRLLAAHEVVVGSRDDDKANRREAGQ
jgi:hypothetical protein